MRSTLQVLALALLSGCLVHVEDAPSSGVPGRGRREALPDVACAVAGLERRGGLFDLFLDERAGKVWLRLPPPDGDGLYAQCLYLEGLTTGLGSNPIGLDRGQVRGPWLVRFVRAGGRVLLERPNLAFRARSDDPAEVRATTESFATSVLWAAQVEAQDPDGAVLVDLTPFVVRDAHGAARTLKGSGQGAWTLDRERSVLVAAGVMAFPDNVELEGQLTFQGSESGGDVASTAPDPRVVTLVQHHSFVRLPDDGYRPRPLDPRSGGSPLQYLDYAADLGESMDVRLGRRHRLQRVDPSASRSAVVEPIVYYVDRGAPEPVRSALIEGASWWARAFEAAGFEDAFRVEVMPENAHPLDVRYNVIQWVHRSTRGWSYGNSVSDPRTGEILKGHVTLGSLRVRQDRLLFEGLLGTEHTGSGRPDDPIELALARIRQLSAHEVGHTLGFAHNFTASTYADRASVMDYPAPLVRVAPDGQLDVSDAYAVGVGAWDEVAVAWLYGEFPPGADEARHLDAILDRAHERGIRYHSDADARPPGAAQPYANLWDNFGDPVTGLENTLAVRRVALGRFGERNLRRGEPRTRLEEVLAPLYFHHRYQVDAAGKMLGGVDYDHALAGDGRGPGVPIDAAAQRRALAALLVCLDPAQLDLPEDVLRILGPRPPGIRRSREQLATSSAPLFDALGAAATAAKMVVDGLLQPERAARLVDQHRRDPDLPSLEEVLEGITDAAFGAGPDAEPRRREIQREVQAVVVAGLIGLADAGGPHRVRARAEGRLRGLLVGPLAPRAESEQEFAHRGALRAEVLRFLDRSAPPADAPARAANPPPGSPIGSASPGLAGCSWGG